MKQHESVNKKRHCKKSKQMLLAGIILSLSGLFFLLMPATFIRQHFAADSSMAFFIGMLCFLLGITWIAFILRKKQ